MAKAQAKLVHQQQEKGGSLCQRKAMMATGVHHEATMGGHRQVNSQGLCHMRQ